MFDDLRVAFSRQCLVLINYNLFLLQKIEQKFSIEADHPWPMLENTTIFQLS